MTPDRLESLRADFEAACLTLPEHERPNLELAESDAYRLAATRRMFEGYVLGRQHDGEATGPEEGA